MQKNDNSISAIRLISLLMIISCHILQGLDIFLAFWLNLGVQIFFFMSGFLYGKKQIKDWKEFYKKRLIKILLPASILIFIIVITDNVFFEIRYSKRLFIGSLLGFGGFTGNPVPLSHLWFVSYILICYLITPILQVLFEEGKSSKKVLLTTIIFAILLNEFYVTGVNAARTGNYILGYYFARCCINKKEKKTFIVTLSCLTAIILPVSIILQYNLITDIPEFLITYKEFICKWEHVLLGSLLFIVFYYIFDFIKIKYDFVLKFSDRYSYFIYLVHQIFILNHMSVLFLTKYLFLNIILILVLSTVSGILLFCFYSLFLKLIDKLKNLVLKKAAS